jgi:hypothetical protein
MHLRGFEPLTFGFVDRCKKNVKPVKTKACEPPPNQLTRKLTPSLQKANLAMAELPKELTEIINSWDKLPDHIKQTIQTLVGSVSDKSEEIST